MTHTVRRPGTDLALQHSRHYTLEQAQAVRGWVAVRVRLVRGARATLLALGPRARSVAAVLDPALGGAWPGRDIAKPLVELSRAMAELEAVGIVVRDVERGLIDFPAIREGQEVYLCWLVDDEDEIRYWHGIEDGFVGRRPLP